MQKLVRLCALILSCLLVVVLLSACSGKNARPLKAVQGTSINKSLTATLTLQKMSNDIYSIDLPKGWVIETVGQYTTFGFRAYDPSKPERQIFFYTKMEPFLKSIEAKHEYEGIVDLVGPNETYGYHQYADAQVLYDTTTDYFFFIFNEYTSYANKYGIKHTFPPLNDIQVYEKFKNTTPQTPGCMDNSIIRAGFTSANTIPCEGLFAAQITNKITYASPATGNDLGFYCAYQVMGITAGADEFSELEETLVKSISSFSFTEEYINKTVKYVQDETDRIVAQGKIMQQISDSYNAAWHSRQTTYDVISEKNSDANLGYERLYDTETGEIYRAETGIYDEYYKDSRLQKIDDSDTARYLEEIDYYIVK